VPALLAAMQAHHVRFATWLSWIAGLALIASSGCHTPQLQGTASCFGGLTCGSGQLCKEQVTGAADDASTADGCVTVPDSCVVSDCSGMACPPCVMQLCDPAADHATVQGRILDCSF